MIWIPSYRYSVPKVNLAAPVIWETPIRLINNPNIALISPLIMSPLIAIVAVTNPNKATPNISVGLNDITIARITGRRTNSVIIPKSPPNRLEKAEIDMAKPASPFLAIGYPSKHVAAFTAVPGVFKRMEVTEPPHVTAPIIPPIRNKALLGFIP
jgi:hypothetical protein